ncbi:hypothetical protein JW977_01440 [Candidatus Falkowbacteria bacterium]|nr:hypothetical protein [Candidatus Falkowbacteria bacterium]
MESIIGPQKEKELSKKKMCTVLGIYLSGSSKGLEVLLVNEINKDDKFRLPGGAVLLKGGAHRQRKRENHNLRKYVYLQAEFNIEILKPIGIRTFALYTYDNEIIKVYLITHSQKIISSSWHKNHPNYRARLVLIDEILNGKCYLRIDQITKIILTDFLRRINKKRKTNRHNHLVPVSEIKLRAIA